MNIFRLHDDPILAAEMAMDRHCIKMCLESTQILHTSLRYHGLNADWLYKPFNPKHPSCMWAMESRTNFMWLVQHGKALCAEYTKRYGKHHKCYPLIDRAECESMLIPAGPETPFRLAMPDQFRTTDTVHSYRLYYSAVKYAFATWKYPAKIPEWWFDYRNFVIKLKIWKDDGVE